MISLLPPSRRERGNALLHEIAHIFGSFVAGEVIVCSIVGIACWICLLPLHFQFALLTGLLCGLGYAIPYVGMIVAQVIAAILAVPQGGSTVLWVTIVIFVIARIADERRRAESDGRRGRRFSRRRDVRKLRGRRSLRSAGVAFGIPAAASIKVLFEYFVAPLIVRAQMSDEEHAQTMHTKIEIEIDEPVATSSPVR